MEALKRTTAIFLLLTMTLMVIAPALLADSARQLPVCCRRDGKHHCAMMSAESAEGAGLKVVAEKCFLGSTVTAAIS